MEKKNPNFKKTKDKRQTSDGPQCATQFNYSYKNGKQTNVCNISNSSPLEKESTKSKKQGGNYSDKCKTDKYKDPHSSHKQKIYENSSYGSSAQYRCENDDDYIGSTSDFFKPVFEDHHQNKSFQSKNGLEGIAMKEKIFSSVNQYKNSKISFSKIYHRWLPERQNTLTKLRSLQKEVHDYATKYYKTQTSFKELSYGSRCFKEATENDTIDFFASFAAFVSDAACGITSFAQAIEMDSYQTTFKEIMDHDAEITKDLYDSRSQCVSQYRGIEEVIRKFHPNTLTTTVDNISDTLHVAKHWKAMENAYQKNDMSKLMDEVCNFFDNACQSEVLQNVNDSVQRYVSDNPAALEACKSTGRVLYGAMDTFGERKSTRNSAVGCITTATNLYLMSEAKNEIDHLKSIVDNDTHQSKLESRIEETIDSLETEMKEMNDIYFQLFNIYDGD